ncbi:hypothetical protein DPMN_174887 [Dreissena polymorpha]|uniref:C1q domain-containing protein n=1 Tax=Dreissena polymorpha TaxID=45954 RepID=A0A9D4IGS1_DREPO|nr:hypothetical protein DPMN_174887 [Dreissena polymorpha]
MFNAHDIHVLSNNILSFPTVIYNEANSYNSSTGHFIAPVDGIYYFVVQICTQSGYPVSYFIEKGDSNMNGATRLLTTYQDTTPSTSCSSRSTYVKLRQNEHAWVLATTNYGDTYFDRHIGGYNMFMGMLIQEI